MTAVLVPRRQRGHEILDDPAVDAALAERSLRDVARSNSLFGGVRAVIGELRDAIAASGATRLTLLDVGSGVGDIALRAREDARRRGVSLSPIGLERTHDLARVTRSAVDTAVCGDALALPFGSASVDIVMCSQVLHHFTDDLATIVIREMDRVARQRVIIADLRRSWIAIAGLWTVSYPLGFHPVSRHDGIVSIRRGYTEDELSDIVSKATGSKPRVSSRAGFRVTASWAPPGHSG